jgi:hypothetical protein
MGWPFTRLEKLSCREAVLGGGALDFVQAVSPVNSSRHRKETGRYKRKFRKVIVKLYKH